MKINKDLAEALLMLSAIILVLVSTSEFEGNPEMKTILMIGLGVFAVISGICRVLGARQEKKEE